MDDDYYSIDAILAQNQKVQCTFKTDVPDLGYLDGGSDRDIKASSKLQLPFWLTPMLLMSDFADYPKSVKWSGLVGNGGPWYAFGKMIAGMLDEEQAQEISDILSNTFKQRLADIMDQAQHFGALGANAGGAVQGQAGQEFREGLDGLERELFALAQESAKLTKQWYESSDKASDDLHRMFRFETELDYWHLIHEPDFLGQADLKGIN
ncbi:PSF3_1 [Sanghuangporus weigelae]